MWSAHSAEHAPQSPQRSTSGNALTRARNLFRTSSQILPPQAEKSSSAVCVPSAKMRYSARSSTSLLAFLGRRELNRASAVLGVIHMWTTFFHRFFHMWITLYVPKIFLYFFKYNRKGLTHHRKSAIMYLNERRFYVFSNRHRNHQFTDS